MNPTELPLRDIHLPEAVGWWPLAPGWWLSLLLFILLLTGMVIVWRRLTRKTVKKLALAELRQLQMQAAQQSDQAQAQALSIWLRRVCMSLFGRQQVAALTGDEWLGFLDQALPNNPFSEGAGRLLIEASYQPPAENDLAPLYELCERWLEAQQERHIGGSA